MPSPWIPASSVHPKCIHLAVSTIIYQPSKRPPVRVTMASSNTKDVIESRRSESTDTTGAGTGDATYLPNLAGCPIETINIDHTVSTYHETVVKPSRQPGLSSLNPILDASHKRDRNASPPNSNCLPGTREKVIEEIVAWAMKSLLFGTKHILWIFGYAGCGKSAIAQAVAMRLEAVHRLAASFFFFRGAGDRSRIRRLVETIASQIAVSIDGTAQHIQAALLAVPGLLEPTTPLAVQFQHLVHDPVRAVAGRWSGAWDPFVILIDGFDECEDKEEVSQMIQDLVELFDQRPDMPLRFIITSRVENHLREQLHESKQVRLFNLVHRTSDEDIWRALEASISNAHKSRVLAACKEEWLSQEDKQTLIKHIAGSFIFLTTITNFLFAPFERDHLTPLERLPLALNMNPGFDGLYRTMLEGCQQSPHFSDIIGVIALAHEALSAVDIADLLEIKVVAVVSILVKLHAIIHLPDDDAAPITLWHTSLRDFLNDESRSGHLCAAGCKVHLALICIDFATRISSQDRPASLYARRYVWDHYDTAIHAIKDGGRQDAHNAIFAQVRRKEAFLSIMPSEIANELYRLFLANPDIPSKGFDILKTLCMVMAPLSITQVEDLLDVSTADVRGLLENVGDIILPPRDNDTPITIPSSLQAFIRDKSLYGALFASPERHAYLTRRCIALAAAPSPRPALRYAMQHVLAHYDLTLNMHKVRGKQVLHKAILDLLQTRKELLAEAPSDVVIRLFQSILSKLKAIPHSLYIMRCIAEAESPLSAAQVALRLNIRTDQVMKALSGLRDILNYSGYADDSVVFHHKPFRDFIVKEVSSFESSVQSAPSPSKAPLERWVDARDTDIVIPVIGEIGAGKSYFINRFLRSIGQGDAVVESDALVPCTTAINPVVIQGHTGNYSHIKNCRVVLVDCPGFNSEADPNADYDLSKRIAKWLEDSHRYGTVLGGVIYLHDISAPRFTLRGFLKTFRGYNQYRDGRLAFSSVVIVTSKWGYDSEEMCMERESQHRELSWRGVLRTAGDQKGSRVMRLKPKSQSDLDGRAEEESAWEIVASILQEVEERAANSNSG